jgi:hypothetical protein
MFLLKREYKTFLFIIVTTFISLFFLVKINQSLNQNVFSSPPPAIVSPVPSIAYPGLTETTNNYSPDGAKILTMKKQQTQSFTNYTFSISNKDDSSGQIIFEKKEYDRYEISIPFNTWSPDNTYIFLKETNPVTNNYFLVSTSGQTFPDGSKYINIHDLFVQKLSQYELIDITGWAAPGLLIVNTKIAAGEQGYSFWFEVPSLSFIQLSTYFK